MYLSVRDEVVGVRIFGASCGVVAWDAGAGADTGWPRRTPVCVGGRGARHAGD